MKVFFICKWKISSVFFLVLFSFSQGVLHGQSEDQMYYVVQYLKVQPENESEYLQLELEVWKKMQTARLLAGKLDGWFLYRVVAPTGTSTEYNYVTVNQYLGATKLAGHFENYGIDHTDVLSPEEISMALRTELIRDLVYEEVWSRVDEILGEPAEGMPFRFQIFNSMKMRPGTDETEYQRMELEYWKPMHQKRIDEGTQFGWGLYTMIIPGGTEREFHWATVDYYHNFIDYLRPQEIVLASIHGEEKAELYFEETDNKRDLLKAEVRELIDYVSSQTINQ